MIRETQRFAENWVIYLVALIPLVPQLWNGDDLTTSILEAFTSLNSFTLMAGIILISAWIIRLDSEFSENGIRYRLFPFQLKEKKITWDEVQEVHIRKYNPILEYGGWGLRGFGNSNKAVNVRGNTGIQLVLNNGNRLLIGTQKKEELEQLLNEINRQSHSSS